MERAFAVCKNLKITVTDAPDLSQVVFVTGMFNDATSFNGDIGGWDIRNVKSLPGMFSGAAAFNQER